MENTESKIDLGGRPFKFTDPEKLRCRIEEYFNGFLSEKWTITGLALALECDRDTLLNYEKDKQGQSKEVPPDVIRLIKKAKMMVHNAYELDLRKKGRSGDIFALKNFGWTDKQEVDVTTAGHPIIELENQLKQIANGKSDSTTGSDTVQGREGGTTPSDANPVTSLRADLQKALS